MRNGQWIPSLLSVLCIFIGMTLTTAVAAPGPHAASVLQRDFTLNGEFVHDAGELQLNVTNFGLIGATPGAACSYCDAPSAMWPADSGVDHLFWAGFWVGAMVDGVPRVSTAVSGGFELRADPNDPLDTIYPSFEGAPNGARYPAPLPDDDGDGLEDEDPRNGRDDDGDGWVDEDFAGISEQAFRTELQDDHPQILDANPEHVPLHIQVIQESFAWDEPDLENVIGFEFTIRATDDFPADQVLEDVYVAFFADPDIGPRGGVGIAADDLPMFWEGQVLYLDGVPVDVQIAGAFDQDGDGGASPGWFGIVPVSHPVDENGIEAPASVGIRSFQQFAGNLTFASGGDPTNDAERYDLMSRDEIDAVPNPNDVAVANDYRVLVSVGPFATFEAGDELVVRWVMAIGEGLEGLQTSAAAGRLSGLGWDYDRDGDPSTGPGGREFNVPWISLADGPVSIDDPQDEGDEIVLSSRGELLPNLPNPFNPSTQIRFRLPASSHVDLTIHDAAGRRVRSVDLGRREAGEGAWIWNGNDDGGRAVSSGTYLVRMTTARGVDAQRIVLVK